MVWQISAHSKSLNQYVIPKWKDNKEKKLNACTNVKILNRKKLWFKALVDLEYIYTRINK